MKKFFSYMTMLAIAALMFTSCSKDEEMEPKDYAAILTSGDWRGYNRAEYRTVGDEWEYNNEMPYVIMKFTRIDANAVSGAGYQLEFKNDYMKEQTDKSRFTWIINDTKLFVNYENQGWEGVSVDYKNGDLSENHFSGMWYPRNNRRYVFDYTKHSDIDWNKYFN